MSKKVILKKQVLATEEYVQEQLAKIQPKEYTLTGTPGDKGGYSGYFFPMDEVNALIANLAKNPSQIKIILNDEAHSRVYTMLGHVGFNNSAGTEEVSLHFIAITSGLYFRHYGSATLTNSFITEDLFCFSEDYNG